MISLIWILLNLIIIHSFMDSLDKCSISCNAVNDLTTKTCVQVLNVKVINIIK